MTQTNPRIGALQIGIIVLTAATALIHLYLALQGAGIMFIANGLGYLALVAGLYAPITALAPYRKWIRWALIAFALVTLVGWAAIGTRNELAYADKAIEVLLVILLLLDMRQNK